MMGQPNMMGQPGMMNQPGVMQPGLQTQGTMQPGLQTQGTMGGLQPNLQGTMTNPNFNATMPAQQPYGSMVNTSYNSQTSQPSYGGIQV